MDLTPGVSIVVCCYNSATRLPETLKHLAELEGSPDLALETIIIDNACTDNTSCVAMASWESLGAPYELRAVKEAIPGVKQARIRGIIEARHEIILFCDDDNWLCNSYAVIAKEIMDANPHVVLLGGMSEAVYETTFVPHWFHEIAVDKGAAHIVRQHPALKWRPSATI
ncbi:glycosyltransferase [Pseudomonadota bacterium]